MMKSYIKNNVGWLYDLLKEIYKYTPMWKKIKSERKENKLKREEEEAEIIKIIFDNQYIVQNGLFKGMKYIKRSSGSALLPKILGSYEEPIQGWIKEVIEDKKYEDILDIGCAEGYYACGFAMSMPNAKITAYYIDEVARKNSTHLKELNELRNIEIKAECTHEELNTKSQPNTLVFCDIEGFEKILLDPIKVPNLKYVDMLIESHDCFVPNITEELIERFYLTHTMRIIVDYPFRVNKYNTLKAASKEQMEYITNEKRSPFMKFIYMESINENI